MEKKEIGLLLEQRRELLDLKQEDLAEMAGLTTKTIYMIESGKGNPALDTLQQIAQVLGLEISISLKTNIDERVGLQ